MASNKIVDLDGNLYEESPLGLGGLRRTRDFDPITAQMGWKFPPHLLPDPIA